MADGFVELTEDKLKSHEGIAEINRMLQTLFNCLAGDGNNLKVYNGYGAPSISADNGSLYLRQDGAAATTLYVRIAGAWVGK
jgi:hypothetical protein